MFSIVIFFLTLVAFDTIRFVNAGLFIINPRQGSTCHGGKPCTVDWLDNGQSPLLSAIGVTTVGLYTGKQRLVQTIVPVDVSNVHSLTFIPLPEAGPNSDTYYISFISTTLKQNNSIPHAAFSPFFRLDKMTGSFTEPNSAATSPIAVPSSIIQGANKPTDDGDVLTTITVGVLSTSSPTTPASTSPPTAADNSPATSPISGTATANPSATATPTSTSSAGALSATSSLASGFSTSVLPASSGISSPALSGTLTVPPSSSSSLGPSASSNASTNGAAGVRLSKGTGFSIALSVASLALVL